jgi:hypothetical protein
MKRVARRPIRHDSTDAIDGGRSRGQRDDVAPPDRERAAVDLQRGPPDQAAGLHDRRDAELHRPVLRRGGLDPLELESSGLTALEREDRHRDPAGTVPGHERRIAPPVDDRSIDPARPIALDEGAVHRAAVHPEDRARHRRPPRHGQPHDGLDALAGRARDLHRQVRTNGAGLGRHAEGELPERERLDLTAVGAAEEPPA